MEQDKRLSRKYRAFIISGGARIITTRFFSILYIFVITRLISKADWDYLLVLGSTQTILVLFSTFGLNFSATHFGLGKKKVKGGDSLPFQVTLFVGLPTILLLSELVLSLSSLFFGTGSIYNVVIENGELHAAFLFSNAFAIMMEGVAACQVALLNSDKEAGLRMFYSVTNSIFVPISYYIRPEISSVVWMWGFLMFLTTLLGIKIHPHRADLFKLRSAEVRRIIQYGFVYNLTTLMVTLSGQYDQFIIFLNFEPGVLSDYFWPMRITMIASEAFAVVMTGLFPLLTKIEADYGREIAIRRFRVMFKLTVYFASIFFTGLLVTSDLVTILLGSSYQASIGYLQIFSIMGWALVVNQLLRIRLNSFGSRRYVVYSDILGSIVRMALLTVAAFISIQSLIVARILVYLILSVYMLSLRKFMGIGWSYTFKYTAIAAAHFLIGYVLTIFYETVWIRILIGLTIAFLSIFFSFRTGFIGEEEMTLIRRITSRN